LACARGDRPAGRSELRDFHPFAADQLNKTAQEAFQETSRESSQKAANPQASSSPPQRSRARGRSNHACNDFAGGSRAALPSAYFDEVEKSCRAQIERRVRRPCVDAPSRSNHFQQSTRFAASPASLVSLYFAFMVLRVHVSTSIGQGLDRGVEIDAV